MPDYTVRQGDSTSSIAFRHGMFWETIWDHSANAELRASREDKNILYPGDVLFIPDGNIRAESGSTEQRHRYRLRGVPERIRLRFIEDREESAQTAGSSNQSQRSSGGRDQSKDMPRANVPYVLDIDGRLTQGNTDDDGCVECPIPPDARRGRVILNPSTPQQQEYPLQIGHLNPISQFSGVKQRLSNLGFFPGQPDEQRTRELEAALRMFQERQGLQVTGEADDQTRNRLRELHGS
jgi:hypothetical protein